MRYYYTDEANQTAGPAELDHLKVLAAEGKISDVTSVIPEGGQTWITYAELKGGGATPPPPPSPGTASRSPLAGIDTIMGDTVARLLTLVSGWLSPQVLQTSLTLAARYGHFAVLAGAILGLILAAKLAVNQHSFMLFATAGLGFVLAVAVAQFSAQRFMSAGSKIIGNTPNRLSSKSFLECVGLFAILGALGSLVGGLVASIQTDSVLPMIPALLIMAMLIYFSITALHPAEVNVIISGEATAGEEALSLLSFFCKVSLRLVPLSFFLFAVTGTIFTALALFNVGQEASAMLLGELPVPPVFGMLAQNSPGQMLVLIACLCPVMIYFFFLLSYLSLDLMRAVLAVPGKLDELKES